MNIPEIHLAPPVLFEIFGIGITNSMVATILTSLFLITIALIVFKNIAIVPGRLQTLIEMIMEFFMDRMEIAFGSREKAARFFPLIFTIFIFLIIANQLMLLPFIGSIVTEDGINLLRTPTSHYSLPIALTLIVLFLANILAIATHPIRYIGNFIKLNEFAKIRSLKDIPNAFLEFFLGLMDIIGELAKFFSLSTRLFGNLFAGEVIISIISGLLFYTQFFVPIPFLALSTLAGFVQAFVFAMLSTVYLSQSLGNVESK